MSFYHYCKNRALLNTIEEFLGSVQISVIKNIVWHIKSGKFWRIMLNLIVTEFLWPFGLNLKTQERSRNSKCVNYTHVTHPNSWNLLNISLRGLEIRLNSFDRVREPLNVPKWLFWPIWSWNIIYQNSWNLKNVLLKILMNKILLMFPA